MYYCTVGHFRACVGYMHATISKAQSICVYWCWHRTVLLVVYCHHIAPSHCTPLSVISIEERNRAASPNYPLRYNVLTQLHASPFPYSEWKFEMSLVQRLAARWQRVWCTQSAGVIDSQIGDSNGDAANGFTFGNERNFVDTELYYTAGELMLLGWVTTGASEFACNVRRRYVW